MKLHVLSDIHLEYSRDRQHVVPPDVEFDVLVAAGDISPEPEKSVEWLRKAANGRPVIFVPGNHDFWAQTNTIFGDQGDLPEFDDRLRELRDRCSAARINFLHMDSVVIDRVRFVGCPLWTDLGSHFKGKYSVRRKCDLPDQNLLIGAFNMNDFYSIGARNWYSDPANVEWLQQIAQLLTDDTLLYPIHLRVDEFIQRGNLHPLIAWRWHEAQRQWLQNMIRCRHDEDGEGAPSWKKTVVVTHHPPTWAALVASGKRKKELTESPYLWGSARRPRDPEGVARLSGYGSSAMPTGSADLWIHGHLHAGIRYLENDIPCFANPYGYDGDVPTFDPYLVIDLDLLRAEQGMAPAFLAAADRIEAIHVALQSLVRYLFDEDAVIRGVVQERFDELEDEGAALLRQLQQEFEAALGQSYSISKEQISPFPRAWNRNWQWSSERDIFGKRIDRDESIRNLVAELAEVAHQLRRFVA